MSSETPRLRQPRPKLPLSEIEYRVMKTLQRMIYENKNTNAQSIRDVFMERHPSMISRRHVYVVLRRLRKKKYLRQVKMEAPLKGGKIVMALCPTKAGDEIMEKADEFYREA